MEIRGPEPRDVGALMDLGAGVIGPERAGPFICGHARATGCWIAEANGITIVSFGLIFTPAFYVVSRWIASRRTSPMAAPTGPTAPAE